MINFETMPPGTFGLVCQSKDGTIKQIGMTQDQSQILQLFLASMSKEKPFINMPSNFDLTLKNQ